MHQSFKYCMQIVVKSLYWKCCSFYLSGMNGFGFYIVFNMYLVALWIWKAQNISVMFWELIRWVADWEVPVGQEGWETGSCTLSWLALKYMVGRHSSLQVWAAGPLMSEEETSALKIKITWYGNLNLCIGHDIIKVGDDPKVDIMDIRLWYYGHPSQRRCYLHNQVCPQSI